MRKPANQSAGQQPEEDEEEEESYQEGLDVEPGYGFRDSQGETPGLGLGLGLGLGSQGESGQTADPIKFA